jgi:hypothetical protein
MLVISAHHGIVASMPIRWDVSPGQPLVTVQSCTSTFQIPSRLHTQWCLSPMRHRMVLSPWYDSCPSQKVQPDTTGATQVARGRHVDCGLLASSQHNASSSLLLLSERRDDAGTGAVPRRHPAANRPGVAFSPEAMGSMGHAAHQSEAFKEAQRCSIV